MRILPTIVFSLLCTLSLAQWPNAVDKRLPIHISNDYNLISGTQYDAEGNTYLSIQAGRYVSKPYPYDVYYVPISYQKLDKNGFKLWNMDSTQVICDFHIDVVDKEGGMFIFYTKYHNPKSNEPIYNNLLKCIYINKNGLKKWETEIENYNIFGRGSVYPLSANINAEGNIELYFLKKNVVSYQVLNKAGNKLLSESNALSEVLNDTPIYPTEQGYIYSRIVSLEYGLKFLLTKRAKDWTDVWKKEITIEGNETIDKIFDSAKGTVVLGRSSQNVLYLTLVNPKGEVIINQKQLLNLRDFISNPNLGEIQYHFDSEDNLHLYISVSHYNNNNTQQLKFTYIKINA